MAYQGDYRRGRERDQEFRRGVSEESGWRSGETTGRGFEDEGIERFEPEYGEQRFGRTGSQYPSTSRYGPGGGSERWGEQAGGEGRFGQHGGYSEEGSYDPQRTQGIYPRRPYGQTGQHAQAGQYGRGRFGSESWQTGTGSQYGEGRQQFGQGRDWDRGSEGFRRYGESYGRGPEGFDRETGSFSGYGRSSQGVGGRWESFGGALGYGEGFGTERTGGEFGRTGERGTAGRTRGRFTGRGPKGYTRSDDRIREDVSDMLELHGEIDASEIEVRVENGEVTLEGTVEDRQTKRMAEDVVESCAGVKQVHNRIRVQGNGEQRAGRQTGTTGGALTGTERTRGGSATKPTTRT